MMNTHTGSRILITTFLLALMSILPNYIYAETSVWVAKKSGNTVYLGGTIHLLRPSDYPLPQEYQVAYFNSDKIFLEADISKMNEPALQATIMEKFFYKAGKNLESELTPEAYQALRAYAQKSALPIEMLASMKPFLAIQTLIVGEFMKMGFTPAGVDAYFQEQAKNDRKTLAYFETLDEQLGMFELMSKDAGSEFILSQLDQMHDMTSLVDKMLKVWRAGDVEQLESLFIAPMIDDYPAIYNLLLKDRNDRWMPAIEKMFSDQDTEFILVGAAHLVGKDGLIEQLSAQGYEVQKLELPSIN